MKVRARAGAVIMVAAVGALLAGGAVDAPSSAASCPSLMVYGIQGTGQSSRTANPDLDSGWLSQVLAPLIDGKTDVQRKYVPYNASFGGAVPGGSKPYDESVSGAVKTTKEWINKEAAQCPKTKFGFVGYSQGGHAVKLVVNDIINGNGVSIKADDIAAVATFGEPSRPANSPLFPGAPGQTSPSPVPGAVGRTVTQLVAAMPEATGGGIAPQSDASVDLSAIAGRYASWCTSGDLACDAPTDSPIVHFVTNIAGQSVMNPDDPVSSLATIGEALALTTVKTAVPLINEDLQAPEQNIASLSYQPQQSLSSRLAAASDPRTPLPSIDEGIQALWKIGTIAFNAAKTVVRHVANPATIGQIVLAGATNPAAIIGILAPKVTAAAVELVPPATTSRWVDEAFTTFQRELGDNKDLFSITSALKLFSTASAHGSYGTVPATPTGAPPTTFVTEWLKAAAADLSGESSPTGDGSVTSTETLAPLSPTTATSQLPTTSTSSSPSATPFESLFPSERPLGSETSSTAPETEGATPSTPPATTSTP